MSDHLPESAAATAASTASDADIVRRVLAGEREAFALLVERYLPIVRVSLAGRGLRGADLDDAAQTALVTTFQNLGRLRKPGSFGPYLLKIASRSYPRNSEPEVGLDKIPEPAAASPTEDDSIDALESAVARLPHHMQVVLGLKFQQQQSAANIAAQLGQTVGAVTKTLSRAYEQLRNDRELIREIGSRTGEVS